MDRTSSQAPGTGPPPDPHDVRALLRDPGIHEVLADAIEEELDRRREPTAWKRLQPWVAGAASAIVTVLAFFLPSLQDQWDRMQSRTVIQRYVELGRGFMEDGRYRLAEESFARAFELSESQRLDIEELRLEASVARVDEDPEWGKPLPSSLHESDFLYLLQLQARRPQARAATLNRYALFLASSKRWVEAEDALRRSIALDPGRAPPWVHLGNVLADLGRPADAEAAYRRGIACDSTLAQGSYDLGLLLLGAGRAAAAESAFARAARLDPDDPDAVRQWIEALTRLGRTAEAESLRPRLRRLEQARPAPVRDVAPAAPEDGGG